MSPPISSQVLLHMRYSRESYFVPKFVSIGPYYYYNKISEHNIIEQQVMVKAKEECESYFQQRLPAGTSDDPFQQLYADGMKEEIRTWCGLSSVNDIQDWDNLLRMLVRDSCFIIRIILAISRGGEWSAFFPGIDIKTLRFELLLLDNQIPFFFLKEVYNVLIQKEMLPRVQPSDPSPMSNGQQNHSLMQSPGCRFSCCIQCKCSISFKKNGSHELSQSNRHLLQNQSLSLSHSSSPEFSPKLDEFLIELKPFICLDMPWEFNVNGMGNEPEHLLDLYWRWCIPSTLNGPCISNEPNQRAGALTNWGQIHLRSTAHRKIKSAYELYQKAGVAFQNSQHESGFNIAFRNGTLHLPHLHLDPNQASLLANLAAFEEFKPSKHRVLTSYILLLDGLISTGKDIEVLEEHGVIRNKLGSSQMAATFFNDIGNVCSVNYDNHYCQKQFYDLNRYYKCYLNRQLATLRHKYFHSPWAIISVLAGLMLLALSVLQTYYNMYRYYHHR